MYSVPVLNNLELLTFTGIDARTSLDDVIRLQQKYPTVEFGVLVGTHSGESGYNRYPSLDLISRWQQYIAVHNLSMAIHLCGIFSRDVGSGTNLEQVLEICSGFKRVQVNARNYDYNNIVAFADMVPCESVILQKRQAFTDHAYSPHPEVEFLFDLSGGRGRSSFNAWPEPADTNKRYGYAGGINPDNVHTALEFVKQHSSFRFWLDMETGVRTNDWFDMKK